MSCSRTQHSASGEARTRNPSISGQALYHDCAPQLGSILCRYDTCPTQYAPDLRGSILCMQGTHYAPQESILCMEHFVALHGLLLKMKGREEIYSSEPEPKFPTGDNSDILGMTKSNSPQRCTSGSALICVYFKNVPKPKKCVIIVAIENAKLKLLKVFANNALCDSSMFFITINPGDIELLDILRTV